MTTEVRHGVDVTALGKFGDFLNENPDKGILTLGTTATYEGTIGRSMVHIGPYSLDDQEIDRATRQYTIPFGAWKEVEELAGFTGPTDRMEPVEIALGALAACLIVGVSFNALVQGISLDKIETSVEAEVDPRVLFGLNSLAEAPSCLKTVRAEVKVSGDVKDEDLARLREMAERSPVHTLMSAPNRIITEVSRA